MGQRIPVWFLLHWEIREGGSRRAGEPGEPFLQEFCFSRPLSGCLLRGSIYVMNFVHFLRVKCFGGEHSFLMLPFVIICQTMVFFVCKFQSTVSSWYLKPVIKEVDNFARTYQLSVS